MVDKMFQLLPSSFEKYNRNCLFVSIYQENINKFLITSNYSVAIHKDFCSVEKCTYHILLYSEEGPESLLKKLNGSTFLYQHVDCVFTLYKFRFYGNIVRKNGEIIDELEKAVKYIESHKYLEKCPSITKKRLLRKKFCGRVPTVTTSTQTCSYSFDKRIQMLRNSKYELDLLNIIDCMIDGQGSVYSKFVEFHCK